MVITGVVGKGGYARTRTHTILKYTFAFVQQFIPTAVNNAVFASKPGVDLIPALIHL